MKIKYLLVIFLSILATSCFEDKKQPTSSDISVGVRPFYLIEDLPDSELKTKLSSCSNKPLQTKYFTIGHRGASMQFPEHTKESYQAAARMGAGIIECDVTFTKDKELVCRHSQCDLHTSTNILATDLANKCSVPPKFNEAGELINAKEIKCCTSDISLAEFKTLKGKMDSANTKATSIAQYMNATANWRTDLYTQNATLMTHKESIELFKKLNVKMTPELKEPSVEMPFNGFTREDAAQKMLDEYKQAGVSPQSVFPQSFEMDIIEYWLKNEPEFGKQAVYLDEQMYIKDKDENLIPADYQKQIDSMGDFYAKGIRYIAPPLFALVEAKDGKIVPSEYAKAAKKANLNIIAWSLERSGPLANGGGWYYQTINNVVNKDSDILVLLDVLGREIGVKAVFSDWPATVTYYANCMDLE